MKRHIAYLTVFALVTGAPGRLPGQDAIVTTPQFLSVGDAPLVYMDDTVLTARDFGDYLFGKGLRPSGRPSDPDSLYNYLQEFIDDNAILRNLDSQAVLSIPRLRRRVRWREGTAATSVIYRNIILPRVNVPEDSVEQLYADSLRTLFTEPESRAVYQLLVAPYALELPEGTPSTRRLQMARQRVDSLKRLAENGTPFDSLVAQYSDDSASQSQGGFVGWIYPGNTPYDFDTAAFAASVGEIRGPVETTFGYHLIEVKEVRPPQVLPLSDSLRQRIRVHLEAVQTQALVHAWIDSAMAETQYDFRDDLLEVTAGIPDTACILIIDQQDSVWYGDWKGTWIMDKRTYGFTGEEGTLDVKHESLQRMSYPFVYLHRAGDLGLDRDSTITRVRFEFIRSSWLQLERARLNRMAEVPDEELERVRIDPAKVQEPEKPLHVQILRARDTATIWAAYRALVNGADFETVVRWYHDNVREVRNGSYDLGWIDKDGLPRSLWGRTWILPTGGYTRPLEHDSAYYIVHLVDRRTKVNAVEHNRTATEELKDRYRERALAEWRLEIRGPHRIRTNRSTWNRLELLWRRET